MTGSPDNDVCVTEYGVQTPSRSTILVVSTDRGEAERALQWIQNGRVVHRRITYGGWLLDDEVGVSAGLELAG